MSQQPQNMSKMDITVHNTKDPQGLSQKSESKSVSGDLIMFIGLMKHGTWQHGFRGMSVTQRSEKHRHFGRSTGLLRFNGCVFIWLPDWEISCVFAACDWFCCSHHSHCVGMQKKELRDFLLLSHSVINKYKDSLWI